MRRCLIALSFVFLTGNFSPRTSVAASEGTLVLVGGGEINESIVTRTLELSGGSQAVVAVLPQASAEPDAGDSSVAMWKKAGAKDARTVGFSDRDAARRAIESATLIWMPGGDQNRFMKAIAGTGLDDLIRARHDAGVVVGGTSAGAAILSKVMITGEGDLTRVTIGTTRTAPGLGLWPEVIVDQHFLARQRTSRLVSAVLDHPALVGIGIDESTALIVRGSIVAAIGSSAAIVIDARRAAIARGPDGAVAGGVGLAFHVLRSGMTFDLARQ
jgi:cyanophycinase